MEKHLQSSLLCYGQQNGVLSSGPHFMTFMPSNRAKGHKRSYWDNTFTIRLLIFGVRIINLGFASVKAANNVYNTHLTGNVIMQFCIICCVLPPSCTLISIQVFAVTMAMRSFVQIHLDIYPDITQTYILQATSILLSDVNIPPALCLMAL